MTLGEKIKKAREKAGLTQRTLAGDKITRNMLSSIESGNANPSMDTLKYLAEELRLPIEYLISDDDELFFYEKKQKIGRIKQLLSTKRYKDCIKEAEGLEECDDEIAYILTECYSRLGRELFLNGSLQSAESALKSALHYSGQTIYNTEALCNTAPMYLAICKNLQAPLLEFDGYAFEEAARKTADYEFFRYMSLDHTYSYNNTTYAEHLSAKQMIKSRNYTAALSILKDISENKKYSEYNAFVMFGIYTDMENCYKQLFDFENAYRYSSKRLSLIEGFKS